MILSTNYNPDVLTCLANLSNDEEIQDVINDKTVKIKTYI